MNIEELYKKIYATCVQFAVYRQKNTIENVQLFLPLLNEFVTVFLGGNEFGLDEEDYLLLKQLLMDILNDIMMGLEQRDRVLLEDAIEYGLKEFVELFFQDESELMRLREESVSESDDL